MQSFFIQYHLLTTASTAFIRGNYSISSSKHFIQACKKVIFDTSYQRAAHQCIHLQMAQTTN